MRWKTLYKKSTTGALLQWKIWTIKSTIFIEHGQVDGKLQTTKDVIKSGKNIGKTTETSLQEQAQAEARSKFIKQKKKGYVTAITVAAKGGVDEKVITGGILPMLAKDFKKAKKHIKYPCAVQPKLDGLRMIFTGDSLWSRTRKPITKLPHILEALKDFDVSVLDGEGFVPAINLLNLPYTSVKTCGGQVVLINDSDIPKLKGSTIVINADGYAVVRFKGETHYVHRLVMEAKDGDYVDHKYGDKLDNRRWNLRFATNSQNMANADKKITNTSGYKGVSWFKPHGKWAAEVTKDYKRYHLGYFENLVEAAKAYDVKALELFGEFAKLNFPTEPEIPDFETLVSAIRSDKTTPYSHLVEYHVYDIPDGSKTFEERIELLEDLFRYLPEGSPLKLVPTRIANDEKELYEIYEEFMEMGYEGAMARNLHGKYEFKRSGHLQKVKEFSDAEFKIVGITEGKGKLMGHVAAFLCEIDDEHGKRTFKAKLKGDTSFLKKCYTDHSLWKGRMLTVQFQGWTRAEHKPRFPIGLRLRDMDY